MRAPAVATLAAVLVLSLAGVVRAHHSYADFDVDRTVAIDGSIDDILFANPHVVLKVRTNDGTRYTVTWSAAQQLNRHGVKADELKIGDRIVVVGSPSTKSPEVSRIVEVTRPADKWTWRTSSTAGGIVDAPR